MQGYFLINVEENRKTVSYIEGDRKNLLFKTPLDRKETENYFTKSYRGPRNTRKSKLVKW